MASTDATFNGSGPGPTMVSFLNPPILEGNASGILTLDFDQPIVQLQFGLALLAVTSNPAGFTVQLFSPAFVSLGITTVATAPTVANGFSEARFSYSGVPASRAVIDFNEAFAPRFAFDNLFFTPIPEPSTAMTGLLMIGFCGCSRLRFPRLRR